MMAALSQNESSRFDLLMGATLAKTEASQFDLLMASTVIPLLVIDIALAKVVRG